MNLQSTEAADPQCEMLNDPFLAAEAPQPDAPEGEPVFAANPR